MTGPRPGTCAADTPALDAAHLADADHHRVLRLLFPESGARDCPGGSGLWNRAQGVSAETPPCSRNSRNACSGARRASLFWPSFATAQAIIEIAAVNVCNLANGTFACHVRDLWHDRNLPWPLFAAT